jgi:hypothetical protein
MSRLVAQQYALDQMDAARKGRCYFDAMARVAENWMLIPTLAPDQVSVLEQLRCPI